MGSQIKWPNKRLTVTGIGNPLFVTDIENASEDLLEAFAAIYGFAAGDFAIVSGFEYGSGSYTGGIVYMNGTFYKCLNGLVENKYLAPDVQDVQNKIFQDANTYPTYRIYQAVQADAPWSGMPVFSGNMDAYRWSIKRLKDYAASIGVTAASDATSKANAAQAAAISTAASDATTKANAAQTAAASDATTKANAAQANAISAAASYAGAAQTNAINAASTDATNKANAAENNAKTYALTTVSANLLKKVVNIGAWNMNASGSGHISIELTKSYLGITDISKIRSVNALIRRDDDSDSVPVRGMLRGHIEVLAAFDGIQIVRDDAPYDNAYYDDGTMNRGWVIIEYLS